MDFFTEEDFKILQRFAGERMVYDNAQQYAYKHLRKTYEKVKYWADELKRRLFPEGSVHVIRRPTNQGNVFDPYLWAKVYPSPDSLKELAFTVEINADNKFIIKIDTVRLHERHPWRIIYEDYMGNWYNSPIVLHLPYHEVLPFDWEGLLKISIGFIERNLSAYRELTDLFKGVNEKRQKQLEEVVPATASVTYTNNSQHYVSINNDGAHRKNNNDLLGIEKDLGSLASLIALKDLVPPLAIALFGEWGSGKSFFMYNLQERINDLCKAEELLENYSVNKKEQERPFCKGVVQITFNAWSYMDVNLWASLTNNIFEKLDHHINNSNLSEEEIQKVKEILQDQLSVMNEAKITALKAQKRLIYEREELSESIHRAKIEKEAAEQKTARKYSQALYTEIRSKLFLGIEKELEQYGISEEDIETLSGEKLYEEVKSWRHFIGNVLRFSSFQKVCMLLGVFLLVLVIINPNGIIDNVAGKISGFAVSAVGFIGPLIYGLILTSKRFQKIYRPIKEYKDGFNKALSEARQKYEDEVKDLNSKLAEKADALKTNNEQLVEIEDKIEFTTYDLQHSITDMAFFNFLNNKHKDERYDKSLSIISTIRKDFETLSQLFVRFNEPTPELQGDDPKTEKKREQIETIQKIFAKKPLDRIVLYIDDLDRCSEQRVVEVLEAVNLLMAYPLFVVVVGVDPRWVSNALIKEYTTQFTGVLNNQNLVEKFNLVPIRVTDYLEKIFQIPFQLRKPESENVTKFLEDMFEGQLEPLPVNQEFHEGEDEYDEDDDNTQILMGENSGKVQPKDLVISRTELKNLQELAWLVGTNPRSLKRYGNIYRIIRAHEGLTFNKEDKERNFICVMFLLGLGIGKYKDKAVSFFDFCMENPDGILRDLLSARAIPDKQIPESLLIFKGEDFNRYIPFVRRFSFER